LLLLPPLPLLAAAAISDHICAVRGAAWLLQGRRVEFDDGKGSGIVLWQRIPLIFVLRDDENPDSVSYSTALVQASNATLSMSETVLF